jgi:chondroitin AC lyase
VAAYSKKSPIEILSNTAAVQAVRNKDLNITQVVFYEAAELKIDKFTSLSVNKPCMVMIDSKSKVTVSDPSRKLDEIELNLKVKDKSAPMLIRLPKDRYAGSSVEVPEL